jgi:hypothetical protein
MSVKHNTNDGMAVIVTTAGRFHIYPYGLSFIDVYNAAGRHVVIERTARGWRRTGGLHRYSIKALVPALKRWIAADPSRFHEMGRRSLKGDADLARNESIDAWAGVLRRNIEVLKAAGGTIDGLELQHYERALKLSTAAVIASLKRERGLELFECTIDAFPALRGMIPRHPRGRSAVAKRSVRRRKLANVA